MRGQGFIRGVTQVLRKRWAYLPGAYRRGRGLIGGRNTVLCFGCCLR